MVRESASIVSLKRAVFEIFDFKKNVVTLKCGSEVTQGYRNRHESIHHL